MLCTRIVENNALEVGKVPHYSSVTFMTFQLQSNKNITSIHLVYSLAKQDRSFNK